MTEMRHILSHLTSHKTLLKEEARQVLSDIASGIYTEIEMASFLTIFLMRSITVEELSGFRDALLEHCLRINLKQDNMIDLCGTGGDAKDTFNISTLASFVTAGAGAKVSKHGNYSVSSSCGSSNILEHFGYKFTSNEKNLQEQIDKAGICFLHAPLFNPAMKNVAPVRKSLRVKTFFNMLGPMVNPSFPNKQIVGVFSLELARLYGYIYQKSSKDFVIIHSLDGYDEISLTGSFKAISNKSELLLSPADLGMKPVTMDEIKGGAGIEDSAEIFQQIISGNGTEAQNNVVCANAAFALQCYFGTDFNESLKMAKDSLLSGKAKQTFNHLIEISKS